MKKLTLFGCVLLAGFALTQTPRVSPLVCDVRHEQDVTYEGKVIEYKWMNPHTHITILVPATAKDPQTVGTWDVEGGSTNIMTRQGWTGDVQGRRADHRRGTSDERRLERRFPLLRRDA